MQSINFITDEGEEIPFYIIEQTTLAGKDFLLVTDSDTDEDEAEVYIMQEISDQDDQTVYEFVEDEAQLEALSKVFAELLDDVDIQMSKDAGERCLTDGKEVWKGFAFLCNFLDFNQIINNKSKKGRVFH